LRNLQKKTCMQETSGTTARAAATDWRAVAVLVAAGMVVALQVGKGIITLTALRADFSLDLASAGWVISVFAFIGVVGGIPTGMAVNRFGDRFLCIAGLVILALGSLLSALACHFATLLAGRFIEGLGFLLVVVAAPALFQHIVAAKDRDFVFGLWSTYMPAGMALAVLCGAAVEGWRGFWLLNAGLTAIAALLVMLIVPRREMAAGDLTTSTLARDAWTTLMSSGPLLLAVTFTLYSLLYFALAGFLPILLTERMGVASVTAGILSAIVIAVNILGNLAAGILLGRSLAARWSLIAIASIVMGLSGLAIFLAPLPSSIIFLLCIIFSSVGGLLPATAITSAPLLVSAPRLAPMALGLVMQGSNLGQVVGPVTVGAAVYWAGWPAAAWPVAAAAVLALLTAFLMRAFPRMKRNQAD
jgi:MFS transporter, DHA1 family, inner membrane transport protein